MTNVVWLLIWFTVVPEQGVQYHHLATFANETLCKMGLKNSSVLVNAPNETIECIGVTIHD